VVATTYDPRNPVAFPFPLGLEVWSVKAVRASLVVPFRELPTSKPAGVAARNAAPHAAGWTNCIRDSGSSRVIYVLKDPSTVRTQLFVFMIGGEINSLRGNRV
jgi:hypothetical protein